METAALTFADLAALQPRLLALLAEAGCRGREPGDDLDRERGWVSLKRELRRLVGWGAPQGTPLASSRAYELCYESLHKAFWGFPP
jgi:hypothetical protein